MLQSTGNPADSSAYPNADESALSAYPQGFTLGWYAVPRWGTKPLGLVCELPGLVCSAPLAAPSLSVWCAHSLGGYAVPR